MKKGHSFTANKKFYLLFQWITLNALYFIVSLVIGLVLFVLFEFIGGFIAGLIGTFLNSFKISAANYIGCLLLQAVDLAGGLVLGIPPGIMVGKFQEDLIKSYTAQDIKWYKASIIGGVVSGGITTFRSSGYFAAIAGFIYTFSFACMFKSIIIVILFPLIFPIVTSIAQWFVLKKMLGWKSLLWILSNVIGSILIGVSMASPILVKSLKTTNHFNNSLYFATILGAYLTYWTLTGITLMWLLKSGHPRPDEAEMATEMVAEMSTEPERT